MWSSREDGHHQVWSVSERAPALEASSDAVPATWKSEGEGVLIAAAAPLEAQRTRASETLRSCSATGHSTGKPAERTTSYIGFVGYRRVTAALDSPPTPQAVCTLNTLPGRIPIESYIYIYIYKVILSLHEQRL